MRSVAQSTVKWEGSSLSTKVNSWLALSLFEISLRSGSTMDKSSPEHVLRDTGNLAKALGEIMFKENVLTQSDHEC